MPKSIFITGTGTDVGKTYIAALLVEELVRRGEKVAYFKAAASGNQRREDGSILFGDGEFVKQISGLKQDLDSMCPYLYEAAVSPHLAAKLEGNPVQLDQVIHCYQKLADIYDYLIVEGAGGIICPIAVHADSVLWQTDIIRALQLTCLLVADAGLGTINACGLSCHYLHHHSIECRGIIFNRYLDSEMHRDNLKFCEELTSKPILATVKPEQRALSLSDQVLKDIFV